MGFDLYGSQESIRNFLTTTFTGYSFIRGSIISNTTIPVDSQGTFTPYFVLRFSPLLRNQGETSVGSTRLDEYFCRFTLNAIAPTEDFAARMMNVVRDSLIGFNPISASFVVVGNGSAGYTIANTVGEPIAYVDSQPFQYGLNFVDPLSTLTPS